MDFTVPVALFQWALHSPGARGAQCSAPGIGTVRIQVYTAEPTPLSDQPSSKESVWRGEKPPTSLKGVSQDLDNPARSSGLVRLSSRCGSHNGQASLPFWTNVLFCLVSLEFLSRESKVGGK